MEELQFAFIMPLGHERFQCWCALSDSSLSMVACPRRPSRQLVFIVKIELILISLSNQEEARLEDRGHLTRSRLIESCLAGQSIADPGITMAFQRWPKSMEIDTTTSKCLHLVQAIPWQRWRLIALVPLEVQPPEPEQRILDRCPSTIVISR